MKKIEIEIENGDLNIRIDHMSSGEAIGILEMAKFSLLVQGQIGAKPMTMETVD